jgi:hypothetical protein
MNIPGDVADMALLPRQMWKVLGTGGVRSGVRGNESWCRRPLWSRCPSSSLVVEIK